MRHCFLDLETLATPEDCYNPYVLSLASLIFDDEDPNFRKYFYRRLNSEQKGGWGKGTVDFWKQQSSIVLKLAGYPTKEKVLFDFHDVKNDKMDVEWALKNPKNVLKEFRLFSLENNAQLYWGNSPSFDMTIVDHLHEKLDYESEDEELLCLPPWKVLTNKSNFWTQRDVRSLKDIFQQFNLSWNGYKFYEKCESDFLEVGLNDIFGLKHFALYDCVEEAALVYTVKMFLKEIRSAIIDVSK